MHDLLRIYHFSLLVCLLGFFPSIAFAEEVVPDGAFLLQQIEKERGLSLPEKTDADPPVELRNLKSTGGQDIWVNAFKFVGNTLLSESQLQTVVKPYLQQRLNFDQLQTVAREVAETYRKAGWIVKAYLPQQDITQGVVIIQITEAILGRVIPENSASQRLLTARALGIIAAAQSPGTFLNNDALDRGLLLLNDLPGIKAVSRLSKGQHPGETDLHVQLTEQPVFESKFSGDNSGSRATGALRFIPEFKVNSPSKVGDLLAASLIHSEGSDYGRVNYSLPLGLEGWRLGGSISYLAYQLVSAEFAKSKSQGEAFLFSVDVNYPWVRSRLKNLFFALEFNYKRYDNQFNAATISHYQISNGLLSLYGNQFDDFWGGGANTGSLSFTEGYVDLNGSPNRNSIADTTQTEAWFSKFRYSLNRQQTITPESFFYLGFSGQLANKNLDGAEKFYLGGSSGVRAYPANEGGGSEGQLLTMELRQLLPGKINLTGFYDLGHIRINTDNQFKGAAKVNDYILQGAGAAIAYTTDFALEMKLTWAHRLGKNPNPSSTGTDQDGSLDKQRFWFAVSLSL